jgi:anti-anti-sigma factor
MTSQTISTQRNHPYRVLFHVEHRPHFSVVAILDQAGVFSAQLLRPPLDAYTFVVLDLAELTFLRSLAMGALVTYRRGLGRRGTEVRLANVHAQVWLALESAGLGQLFKLMDLEQPARAPALAAV